MSLFFFLIVFPFLSVFSFIGFGRMMQSIGIRKGWKFKHLFQVSGFLYIFIGFVLPILVLFVDQYYFQDYDVFKFAEYYLLVFALPVPVYLIVSEILRNNQQKPPILKSRPEDQQHKNKGKIGTSSNKTSTLEINPIRVFVSYRRSDSADASGRIYDRLIAKFGRNAVFKDVDSIPLGLDFKEYLDKRVGECDVLLAIIGDRWLDASDTTGESRLDDPADFVRIEIESALSRGIPVIPLLVRDAKMPREDQLPSGLKKLVYRNGTPIRSDPDFHRDMDRLISALEKHTQ